MKNLMFQITVKNISAVDFFENLCKQKWQTSYFFSHENNLTILNTSFVS